MNGDGDTPEAADSGHLLEPTRRSVLVGASALAVAASAKASYSVSRNLNLDFLDKTRRQVVVLIDVSAERDPMGRNQVDTNAKPDPGAKATENVVTKASDPKFRLVVIIRNVMAGAPSAGFARSPNVRGSSRFGSRPAKISTRSESQSLKASPENPG